jgi:hypothetical protein
MAQELTEVTAVLKRFRDYVIQQSRSNLSKSNKNVSKELYDSLKGEVLTENNYSIVGFSMAYYGQFQDQGVKGKSSSAKAPNSPFKFGTGSGVKGGLTKSILKWVQAKGFQFREKDSGKFMSYKQTGYLISRSIFHKGIKPSLFFTKPFEAGYKKYIDTDLMKAFGQDIETMVDYNLKDINK